METPAPSPPSSPESIPPEEIPLPDWVVALNEMEASDEEDIIVVGSTPNASPVYPDASADCDSTFRDDGDYEDKSPQLDRSIDLYDPESPGSDGYEGDWDWSDESFVEPDTGK